MRTIYAPKEPLLDIRCELGESPVWEKETETLHFIDIARCEVHHYHLPSKAHSVDYYAEAISCIRLRKDRPGFIAVAPLGFCFLPARSPSSSPTSRTPITYHTLASNSSATTQQMFNDGEIDPQGRFLAATKILRGLAIEREKREATLFRVGEGRGGAEVVLENMGLPNGIGWTSAGSTVYITDSLLSTISRYSYSSDGTLSNKSLFVDTRTEGPSGGIPDGLVLDGHDNVYSAKFRGSRVTRYTPAGIADLEIVFEEAYNITCVELGGKERTTLFVTTAAVAESGEGGKRELVEKYWRSGAVWAIELGAEGVKPRERERFVGDGGASAEEAKL